MTRGQVASVSIGSGFRNAPGMPEPNILFTLVWRRRAQAHVHAARRRLRHKSTGRRPSVLQAARVLHRTNGTLL